MSPNLRLVKHLVPKELEATFEADKAKGQREGPTIHISRRLVLGINNLDIKREPHRRIGYKAVK